MITFIGCIYLVIPLFIFFLIFIAIKERSLDGVMGGILILFIFCTPILIVVSEHANDLAIVRGWNAVYEAHLQHVKTLEKRIDEMSYKNNSEISLNADTPYASIVEAYKEAQKNLANHRAKVSAAKVDIEARRLGWFGIIVIIMGQE